MTAEEKLAIMVSRAEADARAYRILEDKLGYVLRMLKIDAGWCESIGSMSDKDYLNFYSHEYELKEGTVA